MYLYRHTETDADGFWLWTVGYYTPSGKWEPESDHSSAQEAAARVHYLNGGK